MLTQDLVDEAVEMVLDGASNKDLYTYLFVSKDDFDAWFTHGRDQVNEGHGRTDEDSLKSKLDNFDYLCLILYKGIMKGRWIIKKEIHKLVAESDNPNIAFKYLEAVYATDFNPKFREDDTDKDTSDDEAANTYVMGEFFRQTIQQSDLDTPADEIGERSNNETKSYPKTQHSDTDESFYQTQES